MLTQIQTILHWFQVKTGQKLPRVFLSKEESRDITKDNNWAIRDSLRQDKSPELFGTPVTYNDLAAKIREKQLEMLITRAAFDILPEKTDFGVEMRCELDLTKTRYFLESKICSNTQTVAVEVVADAFESLKLRWPKIQKWWPLKKKSVALEAKVLYPYLDIRLPFNTHFVKFNQL